MKHLLTLLLLFCTLSGFAKDFLLGADISWCTEQEKHGHKLYNFLGEEREATALMHEMGLNTVRLRVWVNPADGFCSKEDVLVKALRAKALGMKIMIDFHYSDSWADPGKQNIPAAWAKHKYKQLLVDVANHTTEVLQILKDNGINVEYVQVGNETSNGFLWPIGQLDLNPKQYAGLFAAGYDAVKAVMPDAKVIVHLDNGYDDLLYNRNLDALRDGGAKWDIIGISLYPYWARDNGYCNSAQQLFQECLRNIRMVSEKYGTDVIITETGFEVNEKEPWVMEVGRTQLSQFISLLRNNTNGHCLGLLYWEPTCQPSNYKLGAFTEDGHPTAIMRAFTSALINDTEITGNETFIQNYDRPLVKFSTSLGDFIVELYNETPLHRDNFIKLTQQGLYDGSLFHRIIPNFMIQGGDIAPIVDANGDEVLINAEITYPQHFHKRGALCAARMDESKNPELKSSSTQFYIAWGRYPTARKAGSDATPLPYYLEDGNAGIPYLDSTYTVFGEVISNFNVIEQIQKQETDANAKPINDITITKIKRIR